MLLLELSLYYTDEDLKKIDQKFVSIKEKLPVESQRAYEDHFYDLVFRYNFLQEEKEACEKADKTLYREIENAKKKIKYHLDKNPNHITKKAIESYLEHDKLAQLKTGHRRTKKPIRQFFENIKMIFFLDKGMKSAITKKEIETLIALI